MSLGYDQPMRFSRFSDIVNGEYFFILYNLVIILIQWTRMDGTS